MTDREKLIELLEEVPHAQRLYPDMYVDKLIENGVTVLKWISVEEEQKPKNMQECLCVCTFNDYRDYKWINVLRWYAIDGNGYVDRPHFTDEGVHGMCVTHWHPMIKLP